MSAPFVGIAGRSGVGKDTLAERMVAQFGFRRIAIADPLKELTGRAFELSREQLWGDGRDLVDPRWNRTPRQLYQQLGDALRGCHPETLIRMWLRKVHAARAGGSAVVTPDVRTTAEFDAVRAAGGALWRIERRDHPPPPGGLHQTETALDGREDWDALIANDGSVVALRAQLRRLCSVGGRGDDGIEGTPSTPTRGRPVGHARSTRQSDP